LVKARSNLGETSVKAMGGEEKAALARAHSKTCRTFGGILVREASWSAERSSALALSPHIS